MAKTKNDAQTVDAPVTEPTTGGKTASTIEALNEKIAELEGKLEFFKGAVRPDGDAVYLGGVFYKVLTTIRADSNDAEVKKGLVDEGACLVVINKVH